jgi:hypothetical protein
MSLRHGLRSFSAKRRRTVSRDTLSCAVSLTSARPTGMACRGQLGALGLAEFDPR